MKDNKSKKIFFWLGGSLLCGFLLFIMYHLNLNNHPLKQENPSPEATIFTINNLVSVQFGDTLNLLKLSTVHYSVEQDSYIAKQVEINQYQTNKKSLKRLTQLNAPIVNYESEETKLVFSKHVNITQWMANHTSTISMGKSTYQMDKQSLNSNEAIHIHSPQGDTSANAVRISLAKQTIELFNQVNAVFRLVPDESEK